MSNVLTITSINDQFDPVTLGPDDDFLPKTMEGRLGSDEPVRIRFTSPKIRQVEALLRSIGVPQGALVNGEPARSMDGTCYAQTLAGGFLVELSLREGTNLLMDRGIFSVLTSSMGPGGPFVQSLELIFYPMPPGSRLYNAAGDYEEIPVSGPEEPGDGDGDG